ncbi:MAG: protein translocase subunit SecF [Actinobacteria bacterium]|nr:protein translocase subunit SecF [Actinomycetota bacterium]MCG2795557.1 protein translocase subunit SecF [Actinomycetes bacterium]
MRILPRRRDIDIIGKKYIWFSLSGVIILVALVALFTRGLNFGIDFTGGTQFNIKCEDGTSISQVRDVMGEFGYGDAKIQLVEDSSFIIKTPRLDKEQISLIEKALEKNAGMEKLEEVYDVGPGWGAQVSHQALIALLVFLVAILIYISLRFELKMAICAVIALFHDVVVTVGVYALVGREVTPATIIAVLTIMGYSLYDTIVIFDRVKENTGLLTRQSRKTYSQTVNDALNQVMARSINTSLTTLIPILAIMLFGGETLKAFAFALFIGVIAGTCSSIFIASPLLAAWKETDPKFRAYRERVERRDTRKARAAKTGEAQATAGKAAAGARSGTKPAAKKKVDGARAAEVAKPEPAAKPKPKPAARKPAGQKPEGQAKSRTKGPGSGKKRKKKKKKK